MRKPIPAQFPIPLLILVLTLLVTACTTEMRIVVDLEGTGRSFRPKSVKDEIQINVLAQAIGKAKELGGDLLQVTQIYAPDMLSTCFRIDASVYALPEAAD